MSFQITRAKDSDLSLMQRFFYQTVTTYGSKIFTKSEIKIYSRLATNKIYWQKKFKEYFIYNAKWNGEIVGSFSMDKTGSIEFIFVHMEYHGKGIANQLYDKLEEIARENNIKILTTPINLLTKSFFEKQDFEIIKNSVNVVGGEEVVTYSGVKKLKS
ncbi:GNAT family N-acetyltransferase [Aquimarina sp. MMG016]|uniref:GNAT family N-acetyltransferase n=1 Tax=Aquimarina sp. MMG016 TaxID=2822690 RepID=UPI001B3A758C|nr:GNAT family N-acetyltransferase [Aquimarina sp. MMG016]MBQ4821414.1 GNAT family N-acetyltransferase [Aquimarina sp. MMG016]